MKSHPPQLRVACVWLPNWPIQRLVAAGAELKARSVLLYEAKPQRGLKIAACSRAARRAGVHAQMPLAEAIALVEGDRNAREESIAPRIEAHDPIADRQAIEELALWCQQFSPIVGLEEVSQPSSLYLDVTGLAPLFGGEKALAARIRQAFAERRITVRTALADTLGAAWGIAHFAEPRNELADFLLPTSHLLSLPVAALRLLPESVDCLSDLGIDCVEQLAQLPRETLSSRFGELVLKRLDQARGLLPEALVSHKPSAEFQVEWLLEHPTDRQAMIDFVLESLVEKLIPPLVARREGILRLECRMDLQSTEPLRFCLGLYRASTASKHLLGLLHLQLEKLRLRAKVCAIRLTVLAVGALEREQQELFAEDRDLASPRHLASLVDRLASRLGREAVLQPKLLADAQPEHACQYFPLAGRAKKMGSKKSSQKSGRAKEPEKPERALPLRPLWLAAPIALEAMAVAPEGPPIRFSAAGSEHRVKTVWGPERIETGWWRHQGVRRDYYRVETQTGQRFWLFRRLKDHRWFLHGAFD
jgi:protein ImuB